MKHNCQGTGILASAEDNTRILITQTPQNQDPVTIIWPLHGPYCEIGELGMPKSTYHDRSLSKHALPVSKEGYASEVYRTCGDQKGIMGPFERVFGSLPK